MLCSRFVVLLARRHLLDDSLALETFDALASLASIPTTGNVFVLLLFWEEGRDVQVLPPGITRA